MADISEFSIVTYERKPGHWRAAIIQKGSTGNVGGDKVRSVVTPEDYPSEADAWVAKMTDDDPNEAYLVVPDLMGRLRDGGPSSGMACS